MATKTENTKGDVLVKLGHGRTAQRTGGRGGRRGPQPTLKVGQKLAKVRQKLEQVNFQSWPKVGKVNFQSWPKVAKVNFESWPKVGQS